MSHDEDPNRTIALGFGLVLLGLIASANAANAQSFNASTSRSASVSRIVFNANGSTQTVSRSVGGNQIFTDNRGKFAGATRRTPSGTLVYDNRRKLSVVVRNTPSGTLIIDRTTGATTAIRRTPSGVVFTDDTGRITGGERDPFAAPGFSGLGNFERAIGDEAGLAVVSVDDDTGVAITGGLQVNLAQTTLDVVVVKAVESGKASGAATDAADALENTEIGGNMFAGSDMFASFATGAEASCAGAGCELHGVGHIF